MLQIEFLQLYMCRFYLFQKRLIFHQTSSFWSQLLFLYFAQIQLFYSLSNLVIDLFMGHTFHISTDLYLPITNSFQIEQRTSFSKLLGQSWHFSLWFSIFFRNISVRFKIIFHYFILSWWMDLSLIHIWRCRRSTLCRSRWSPYH